MCSVPRNTAVGRLLNRGRRGGRFYSRVDKKGGRRGGRPPRPMGKSNIFSKRGGGGRSIPPPPTRPPPPTYGPVYEEDIEQVLDIMYEFLIPIPLEHFL